jgi:hypothetical protein
LGDKTPKEEFSGLKPKIGHLRIFLVVQYTSMCLGRRGKRWSLQGRRVYLGVTVRPQRIIGYPYQHRGRKF